MLAATAHVRRLDAAGYPRYAEGVARIAQASGLEMSRASATRILCTVEHRRGVCFVALIRGEVAGYCLGAPLELFAHLRGVRDDPRFGRGDVLFAAALAVDERFRGHGLGRRLKRTQITCARRMGYDWVAGRDRHGDDEPAWRLNQALGATELAVVRDAFDDGSEPRDGIYYHIDLGRPAEEPVQMASGASRPEVARPALHGA